LLLSRFGPLRARRAGGQPQTPKPAGGMKARAGEDAEIFSCAERERGVY